MIYLIANPIKHNPDVVTDDQVLIDLHSTNPAISSISFGNEALARTKLQENATAFLTREAYRFTVSKEIVNGNDTTWMLADLENDNEDSTYHVFNQKTGVYETVNSLTLAKEKLQQFKDEFLSDVGLCDIVVVEEVPQIKLPKYGTVVGTIPVEVM